MTEQTYINQIKARRKKRGAVPFPFPLPDSMGGDKAVEVTPTGKFKKAVMVRLNRAGFKTQREFARHIGWSDEHLSRVFLGKKHMPLLLQRYLDVIDPAGADT